MKLLDYLDSLNLMLEVVYIPNEHLGKDLHWMATIKSDWETNQAKSVNLATGSGCSSSLSAAGRTSTEAITVLAQEITGKTIEVRYTKNIEEPNIKIEYKVPTGLDYN
jgi:hypothetical protein